MKKYIAILLSFALLFTCLPCGNALSLSTEKTELLSERTAYGKTYRLDDGTFQYVGHTKPIHYKDNSGAYVEINNAITDAVRQAGYKYTNTANQWNAHFSEKLVDSNAVMLTSGKYEISFSLMEQTAAAGVVKTTTLANTKDTLSAYHKKLSADNRAVLYRDVAEDVDIAYTVQEVALKEDIILKSKLAPSVYKFRLTADGLTIRETDGIISLYTAIGEEVFSFAPLYMEDANGKRSEKVTLTYAGVKNGYELTVSADTEFLNAKDTAYPVVIDPSVYIVSGTTSAEDTYVDQQYPNSSYGLSESLLTGGASSTYAKRTYLQFYYPLYIRPFQVTSVYLYMPKEDYQTPNIRAYAVTSGWATDMIWNGQPSHSNTIYSSQAQNVTRYGSSNWYRMELTDIFNAWMDLTLDDYGLVLKEVNESSSSQKTSFYSSEAPSPNNPEFEINYNPYYGSRPYQSTSRADINCMGYALEYPYGIYQSSGTHNLGITDSDIDGLTLAQLEKYIADKCEDWMLSDDDLDWVYLATYFSSIEQNWYRVVLRVGFYDRNGNGVLDRFSDIPGDPNFSPELFDYHWFYQTSTGDWAEKHGSLPSECRDNTADLNPVDLEWDMVSWSSQATPPEWYSGFYNSNGRFYGIRDIRTVSW
ncbi:MAG: DNRLRE domain-containing protein [Oscillospiraceae bacterium]|nr:DNRLRE domain-containing protein [Oscillospiraceae bacterium]